MADISNIQSEHHIPQKYVDQWRKKLDETLPKVLREAREVPLDKQQEHGWKPIKQVEGVRILKKKIEGRLVAKGICEIETCMTPQQFMDFVDQCHSCAATERQIVSNVLGTRVVTKLEEGHCVMHLQVETPGGVLVSNRDFVFIVGTSVQPDPTRTVPSVVRYGCSVEHPELLKPARGFARGEMWLNGWYVEQVGENRIVAQYFMSNSIGGWIPSALIEKQLLDGPLTLIKYRYLAERTSITIAGATASPLNHKGVAQNKPPQRTAQQQQQQHEEQTVLA